VRLGRKGVRKKTLRIGDHVEWNCEAGRVCGRIIKRVTADIVVKGYVHHASPAEPQYLIQSDKTVHVAIHKGTALRIVKGRVAARTRSAR
jgi:hypothetical protein